MVAPRRPPSHGIPPLPACGVEVVVSKLRIIIEL